MCSVFRKIFLQFNDARTDDDPPALVALLREIDEMDDTASIEGQPAPPLVGDSRQETSDVGSATPADANNHLPGFAGILAAEDVAALETLPGVLSALLVVLTP